ncbi:hypothetical protein ACJXBB_002407 [Vibrio cholerae]|nr:hypothetical protein [Vibrio cholerae]EHW0636471.1 hypothetical protein [Vibrio vulnificus]EGR1265141.1 hypothetical protein [Vibrio cholerae]EIA0778014.1 hypothetical protein [Vibrio cholerae]EIU7552679.1 hypothetical protein [Vibrio vulnificus]
MLFLVNPETPRFRVFSVLNNELLGFLERSVLDGAFRRELFNEGAVGQACWDNAKENNRRSKNDLTRDKFEKFFIEFQKLSIDERNRLYNIFNQSQDLPNFFNAPSLNSLDSFPNELKKKLTSLTSHLYTATKDLQLIVDECDGINISNHFRQFQQLNGNVCKACGMALLSPIRANVSEEEQWRADYDHQLCKSKYPFFAVHPDNLIPICDTCNQDAKKAKDLFKAEGGRQRKAFFPYQECSNQYIAIDYANGRDPEPYIELKWHTADPDILEKLNGWDDVYEIKNLVEGRYNNISAIIIDEINPVCLQDFIEQLERRSRQPREDTFKRRAYSFWDYKFFHRLQLLSAADKESLWEQINFSLRLGEEGANFILEGG